MDLRAALEHATNGGEFEAQLPGDRHWTRFRMRDGRLECFRVTGSWQPIVALWSNLVEPCAEFRPFPLELPEETAGELKDKIDHDCAEWSEATDLIIDHLDARIKKLAERVEKLEGKK